MERLKKIQKLIRCVAMLIGFLIIFQPLPVFAQNSGNIHIKLMDTDGNESVKGIKLALYKIADCDQSGEYILNANFLKMGIDTEDLCDDKKNHQNINVLDDFINKNKVSEMESKISGSDGVINYAGLPDGIYFVKQVNDQKDFQELGYRYETDSYLIVLPWMDETGNLIRSVNCKPKGMIIYPDTEKNIIVHKVWKDYNNKAGIRPENIEVGLYSNNELKQKITLNAANNWTYQWKNLSTKETWKIKELEIPKGYVSKIAQEGDTYTITNQWTEEKTSGDSDVSKTTKRTYANAKTGDTSNFTIYIMIMVCSALLLFEEWIRKSKKK